MDGRPWLEICNEPMAAKYIDSWESVPGDAGMHHEELREDPAASAMAIRRLVDLGYLDPPSADGRANCEQAIRDAQVNRAVAVASSRRVASALPLWQELADSYPEEQGFRLQVAACLLRLGRWAECHDALDQLSGGLRQSPHAQLVAAGLALGEGRVEHARAIARELSAGPLDNAALYNQLGQLFIDTSAWSEAETAFRASLATVAENPVALDGLAQLSLRRGDFAVAVEHAIGAVGLMHFFPAAHFHLAEALVGLTREAEAIAAYETALKMGFEPRATHSRLAELYRLRNPAKAKHHENCSLLAS